MCDIELKNYAKGAAVYGANNFVSDYETGD
jgi:hypothetical protein